MEAKVQTTYIKTNYLSDDAKWIREEVFVKEQKFHEEFDKIDPYANHVVLYYHDKPIAVFRYFKGKEEREYMLGRIAIVKEYRGRHLGKELLHLAEQLIAGEGGMRISLSAQTRAKEFYKKNGYIEEGAPYFEEYCEHIHMKKELIHI